jgi:hypothetical protein
VTFPFDLQVNGIAHEPHRVGLLVHPWGDVVETDPDWIASKTFPDMLPFPNPARHPDPMTFDPWKHALSSSPGMLKPLHQLEQVFVQKEFAKYLHGLDVGEVLHLQLLKIFEMATIDMNRRFALIYPMLKDGKIHPFGTEAKISFGMTMKHPIEPSIILHEVEKAFVRLVQNAVSQGAYPPPPACPHEGCFEFARFKAFDFSTGLMTLGCQKHVCLFGINFEKNPTLIRTLKLWAVHKIRFRSQPAPTSQLSLEEVFK